MEINYLYTTIEGGRTALISPVAVEKPLICREGS
jgi:hypothetical protein